MEQASRRTAPSVAIVNRLSQRLADFQHPAFRLASRQRYRWRGLPLRSLTKAVCASRGLVLPSSPLLRRRAFSEDFRSLAVFAGLSPITRSLPSSKACQKSGAFPPPELPGFIGTMHLSDSRTARHLQAFRLQSWPHGSPTLPGPLSWRAVSTTPADLTSALVGCFLVSASFPLG